MIYIHEIDIDDKSVWGGVAEDNFILPGKIRKIKGVLANVIPHHDTYPKRLIKDTTTYTDEDGNIANPDSPPDKYDANGNNYGPQELTKHPSYIVGGYSSVQIGAITLSINDDTCVIAGMPANMIAEMRNTSYSQNLRMLSAPIEVESGSMMRVMMEEKLVSPFVTEDDMMNEHAQEVYGHPAVLSNGYTIKLYIDYE